MMFSIGFILNWIQNFTKGNLEKKIKILVTKDKILVVMNTCDYKPCSCLGQMTKDNWSQKTPYGMYNHPYSHILPTIARIFIHWLVIGLCDYKYDYTKYLGKHILNN
jgi:hypothetical protein